MFVESQLAVVAIASAVFGYWLATGLSPISRGPTSEKRVEPPSQVEAPVSPAPAIISDAPAPKKNKKKTKSKPKQEENIKPEPEAAVDAGSDSEDERAAVTEASLDQVKPGKWEECKLVLVVNQELGMTKGKIAAQCG